MEQVKLCIVCVSVKVFRLIVGDKTSKGSLSPLRVGGNLLGVDADKALDTGQRVGN